VLERQDVSIQESEQEVRWLQVIVLLQGGDSLEYLRYVRRETREWGTPTISLTGPTGIEGGKVDIVSPLRQILHIEEGALPLVARLFPF
jgi:predicted ThiF/HesA family dinucleotide-utilizing enzyme